MDIEFYTDANNNTPVENFLDTLSPKIKSKTKKTQDTPKEEILLAVKYRTDYLRRHKNG